MAATTLARSSFYEYFESRAALIMEVVEPVMAVNREVLERWPLHPEDPRRAAEAVATALVRAWREQGRLLMALADASATDDDAAAAYRAFAEDSVAQVARKLRLEIEAGTVTGIDPDQTALALVAMNRTYVSTQLFGPAPPADDVLIATLVEIWVRVLWPGR